MGAEWSSSLSLLGFNLNPFGVQRWAPNALKGFALQSHCCVHCCDGLDLQFSSMFAGGPSSFLDIGCCIYIGLAALRCIMSLNLGTRSPG